MTKINLDMDYLTLSHELRIPIAEILGMSELLSEETLSNQQREELNAIQHAGNRLLLMIDKILASHIDEKGKQDFYKPN